MHASAIMRTVGMFIENMDNIQAVVPTLARLGGTHALLGVRPAFFKEFRASFIEAVKEDLGRARFTAEVETAWCTAIDTITSIIVSNYPPAALANEPQPGERRERVPRRARYLESGAAHVPRGLEGVVGPPEGQDQHRRPAHLGLDV